MNELLREMLAEQEAGGKKYFLECNKCGKVLRYGQMSACSQCSGDKEHRKKYYQGMRVQYFRLRNNARDRGLYFGLDLTEFVTLKSSPCHYCGNRPENMNIGIDRKENTVGYIKGNVVACCNPCNSRKHKKPYYKFKEEIQNGT